MEKLKISIPVRTYIDNEVRHLSNKIDIRTELNKLALEKAESEMNYRLEGMNEFRAQLTDQTATFVKKENIDILIKSIDEKVDSNFTSTDKKINGTNKILYIGIGIMLVLQVLSIWVFKFIV